MSLNKSEIWGGIKDVVLGLRFGNAKGLLKPGMVERLVRDGRTPWHIGRLGSLLVDGKEVEWLYYQVPPAGFDPDKSRFFQTPGGNYVFEDSRGNFRLGLLFNLTKEQAAELESRVEVEEERLSSASE